MIKKLAKKAGSSATKRAVRVADFVQFVWSKFRHRIYGVRMPNAQRDRRP